MYMLGLKGLMVIGARFGFGACHSVEPFFLLICVFCILQVGRSVDETLRLVQAFQYTDKHGEVCPAGWKPGKETIIPDPTEKKKYFAKQLEKGEQAEE